MSNDAPRPQRLLVVRLSAIGDCLHALPVVEAIRRQAPDVFIGWAVQAGGLRLLEGLPSVDRFHRVPRGGGVLADLAGLVRLRRELRAARYDTVLDLQGLTKSGVVARLAGARRTVGFGGADSRELHRFLVRERVEVPRTVEHVVDRNLALLPALGFETPERAHWSFPPVALDDGPVRAFLASLPPERPLAVLSPGTTWPTKIWPRRCFAATAERLADAGMVVALAWAGENERQAAEEIAAASGGRALVAPPTSLQELAGLLQRSSVVVTNDSGPLHLAVAVGAPAVGVYGPTDPVRNGPYGWNDPTWPTAAVTLADADPLTLEEQRIGGGTLLPCQFCWKRVCHRGDRACLELLDEGPVVRRALELARPLGARC